MNLVVEFGKLGNIPAGTQIDANVFSRIMNILGPDQMKSLGTAISSADFTSLYDKKNAIEYFMGLNLTVLDLLFLFFLVVLLGFLAGLCQERTSLLTQLW